MEKYINPFKMFKKTNSKDMVLGPEKPQLILSSSYSRESNLSVSFNRDSLFAPRGSVTKGMLEGFRQINSSQISKKSSLTLSQPMFSVASRGLSKTISKVFIGLIICITVVSVIYLTIEIIFITSLFRCASYETTTYGILAVIFNLIFSLQMTMTFPFCIYKMPRPRLDELIEEMDNKINSSSYHLIIFCLIIIYIMGIRSMYALVQAYLFTMRLKEAHDCNLSELNPCLNCAQNEVALLFVYYILNVILPLIIYYLINKITLHAINQQKRIEQEEQRL